MLRGVDVLAAAALVDRALLGAALIAAFLVQVVPAVVAAHRTRRPTGVARGTWLLVLGEVACWGLFGAARGDGSLVVLGVTGGTAALLMLRRADRAARVEVTDATVDNGGRRAGQLQ